MIHRLPKDYWPFKGDDVKINTPGGEMSVTILEIK